MSTKSPAAAPAEVVAIRLERVPVMERVVSLLYVGTVCLMLVVLYAMAETRSLESRTQHYMPAEGLNADQLRAELARASAEN